MEMSIGSIGFVIVALWGGIAGESSKAMGVVPRELAANQRPKDVDQEVGVSKAVVSIVGQKLDGRAMIEMSANNKLTKLFVVECEITDRGVTALGLLSHLRALALVRGSYSRDRVADSLGKMKRLEYLKMSGDFVDSLSCKGIRSLRDLQVIDLSSSRINSDIFSYIKDLSKLRVLWLSDTMVSDEGLSHLGEIAYRESLKELRLDNTRVTDAGLECLRELPRLRTLTLSHTKITDKAFNEIARLDDLFWLDVSNTRVSSKGIRHLNNIKRLLYLNMSNSMIGGRAAGLLDDLPSLTEIGVSKDNLDEEFINSLSKRNQPITLYIIGSTPVEIIKKIESRCPKIKIVLDARR